MFSWGFNLRKAFKSYLNLSKPRQSLALTYLGLCSMITANPRVSLITALSVAAALILSVMGATALTNYVDRDIDALMERTRRRALPSRAIDPPSKALYFGLALLTSSVLIALTINLLFTIFLLWGAINSVIIYNYLTKRRSPLNILLASPTGAMPVLGGWVSTRPLAIQPVLASILVVVWIPVHIWSIVLKWRDDYARAKIPMLPLRVGGEKLVFLAGLLLVLSSYAISLMLIKHTYLLLAVFALNAVLALLSLNLLLKPTARNAWLLFKFTSPYIVVFFTLWVLNELLTA